MENSTLMATSTSENEEMSMSGLTIENTVDDDGESKIDSKIISNDETNSDIEERYNKLEALAVNLKKKLSDLTDQNKLLETENQKFRKDKEDLLSKIVRLSDGAKKIQTIQSEYDKLQDDIELIKNENKRLNKRLENIVLENDSFKNTIIKEKKEVTQLTSKVTCLSQEKTKLEKTCEQLQKKVKDLNNEIKAELMIRQQKAKECEDFKNSLETELKNHKATRKLLDDMKHDCTSNNVLSLEVANYEKSIETLKAQLDKESTERLNFETTVNQHLKTIEVLNTRLSELQDSCVTKTNNITSLEVKNQMLETESREAKLEVVKAVKDKESFSAECKRLEASKKDLEAKVELLSSEISKSEEESRLRIEAFQSHVDELKRENIKLNLTLENSQRETSILQEEFENYKLRAQSVLLKSKTVPSNELEEEAEHYKREISALTEKCENYQEKIESLKKEIILLQGEVSRASANEESLVTKLSLLRKDSLTLMDKYKNQETEMQRLQINHDKAIDILKINHEEEINKIRKKHEEEIENIKLEAELKAVINTQSTISEITPEVSCPEPSPPLIGREECEGSENTETVNQNAERNQIKNTNRNQRRMIAPEVPIKTITPLEQLLEFSFDEHEVVSRVPEDSPEVAVYKNRVKYLTELLADAEKDIAKLTQLNQLLKEDIRRQKRYVEREKEAVNFEYLKNVVFKFVTLENRDERSRLVPVLDTILKLSPEETQKLNEIVSVSGGGKLILFEISYEWVHL